MTSVDIGFDLVYSTMQEFLPVESILPPHIIMPLPQQWGHFAWQDGIVAGKVQH